MVLMITGIFTAAALADDEVSTETETSETSEEGTTEPEHPESQDFVCAQYLLENGPGIVEGYAAFLDEYMQLNVPGSEQVENALLYYRAVEFGLNNLYDEGLEMETKNNVTATADEIAYCSYLRDSYVNVAYELLDVQVRQSAASKTTFLIVDGLKAMNEDLREFSMDFNLTFPGSFNQMDNALPCYARQCITQ